MTLTPNYTDIDFQTMKDRLKVLLEKTETFKDYDFEGSNISVLMELVSYVGDLNTFFTNKLAQNIHPESANIYEVVHSLSRSQGHIPKGYIAPEITVTLTVNKATENDVPNWEVGEELAVPAWFYVDTGLVTDDGSPIYYTTTEQTVHTCTNEDKGAGAATFDITMKQGKPASVYYEYTADDIVSNKIILPVKQWDMGQYPYENHDISVEVLVGPVGREEPWTRVDNFVDDIGVLSDDDDVYTLEFDKYKRYNIGFSTSRNVPSENDSILVMVVETEGAAGNVGANIFDDDNKPDVSIINGNPNQPFMVNVSTDTTVPTESYALANTISIGGGDYQDIESLKVSGESAIYSQNRNVTYFDYIGDLQDISDVSRANAWGEQEENPGDIIPANYNNVYISTIYSGWQTGDDSKMALAQYDVQSEFTDGAVEQFLFPYNYDETFRQSLVDHIEPRKMIGVREQFIVPEYVYFRFEIGVKIKRAYNWNVVKNDILNKLNYYFDVSKRKFNDTIDFRDVYNFVVDPTIKSETDSFENVAGINALTIRDVMVYRLVWNEANGGQLINFSNGAGSGLTINYRIKQGSVVFAEVVEGGINYAQDETFEIVSSGTNAVITISSLGGGVISEASVTTDGDGFYAQDFNVSTTPATGNGSGLVINYVWDSGSTGIGQISIVNGGIGYNAGDTITVVSPTNPGAGDALLTVTTVSINGVVTELGVVSNGDSYEYDIPANSGLSAGEMDELVIFDENADNNFPMFVDTYPTDDLSAVNNTLQPVTIGYNQFPVLSYNYTTILNES